MLLLHATGMEPLIYRMMQNGELHGRLEKQANLFSKGHVEHGY